MASVSADVEGLEQHLTTSVGVAIDPPDAPHMTDARSRALAAAALGLWTVAIVAGRLMAYLKA